ncbi:MAG: hypothetical protein ACOCUY_00265 [Verrucomicrobiota bacterium]
MSTIIKGYPRMQYELPTKDRDILRQLAEKQAEIARLPVMSARKQMWTDMNDGVPGTQPPFVIESWTFDRDFMPPSILQCESDYGRRIERGLLRHIRHHEILGDDHVCPDTFDIGWHLWCDEFGIEIPTERIADDEGVETGYHFDCPIKDLNDGFDCVKPARFGVNKEETFQEQAFLNELFGDILPVRILTRSFGSNNLTQRLMRLVSMETFFMAMYDCPETLTGLLTLLRENARRQAQWAEAEGLLRLNNGNQCTCGSCYNFTTLLPKRPVAPGDVKLSDLWGVMDSQETVGVSPELFHELIYPHYVELAKLYGLVYWGCCEPVDPIWETSIRHLPNLKAVSISRWANQKYMAEQLDGQKIVFSRKPNPNLLGVTKTLDEEAWAQEIRSTLEAVRRRDIPLEFVVRDVYSMHGNLDKARRATEIARREIQNS